MYHLLKNKSQAERLSIASEYFSRGEFDSCIQSVSVILDNDPYDHGAISLLGAVYHTLDNYGMSEIIYRYGLSLYKDSFQMWVGLGTAIRNRPEESIEILSHALALSPDNAIVKSNLASTYVEVEEYEKALALANEVLEVDPLSASANDTAAVASLGLGDFKTGWDRNQVLLGEKWRKEIIYGDEERWNGEKDKTVIIYGEQGIGDEIFYGTVINDAIKDCKKVIIDCDPRLESLFKRSFPDAFVYGTRGKTAPWLNKHKWDYRCAMSDLCRFYRNDKKDFKNKPFLKPDPVRSAQWSSLFGSRTKIGIAFRGGGQFTHRPLREIPIESFRPLTELGELVSLEYESFDYEDFPVEVYDWATTGDYDNAAALVSQLDYVVTTCTSIVHLAGELGIHCYVLTPKHSMWRFNDDMIFHKSVSVIECKGDWDKGIEQVCKLISLRKAA